MFIRPSVYQPPQHTNTKDNEQGEHPHVASLVYKITHSCFIDIKLSMKHSQYQFGKLSRSNSMTSCLHQDSTLSLSNLLKWKSKQTLDMDLVTKQQSLELLRGKRDKKLRPSLFMAHQTLGGKVWPTSTF